jgi:hypothetical protein
MDPNLLLGRLRGNPDRNRGLLADLTNFAPLQSACGGARFETHCYAFEMTEVGIVKNGEDITETLERL